MKSSHSRRTLVSFFFILSTPLFMPSFTKAQILVIDGIQIRADKIESENTPPTTIKITDTQAKASQTLADALKNVPGVEVIRQGGAGQTTSVFIRGARSEGTLVLIDGVEVNDVMAPSRGFDFANMPAENIERIEIYRGPQGVRFGSGALGGVINIISKKGSAKNSFFYLSELGSYGTYREMLSASGRSGALGYSLAGSFLQTQGFSAAAEGFGNKEADGTRIGTGAFKLDWSPSQTSQIEFTTRYLNAATEIDSYGGANGDDPNNEIQSQQWVFAINGTESFLDNTWIVSAGAYLTTAERSAANEIDATNTTVSSDDFSGKNTKLRSEVEWLPHPSHKIRWTIDYREESGSADSFFNGSRTQISNQKQSLSGVAMNYFFDTSSWFFDLGARADESSQSGTIASQRLSIGRKFVDAQTKVYAQMGNGYKIPSLYQIHSQYGAPSLKKENSTAIELTLEQTLGSRAMMTWSAFENSFSDLIDSNLITNRYYNVARAKSQGFEWLASFSVNENLSLVSSYAYLEAQDQGTGLKLLRRPQNTWAVSATWNEDKNQFYSRYSFRGSREDVDPSNFQRIEMPSYALLGIGYEHRFRTWVNFYARIENALNTGYQEVAGYGTASRGFYFGFSGVF